MSIDHPARRISIAGIWPLRTWSIDCPAPCRRRSSVGEERHVVWLTEGVDS